MDSIPPFCQQNGPEGNSYALAATCGHYLRGRVPNEPACLVLYFSVAGDTERVSWINVAADGTSLSYHRGDDFLATVEFAILAAYQHEGISPRSWVIYPRQSVDKAAFTDATARAAYENARFRLCLVLRHMRVGLNVPPLFVAEDRQPSFHNVQLEKGEIWQAVKTLIERRDEKRKVDKRG